VDVRSPRAATLLCGVAGVVALLGLCAAQASAAGAPSLVLGQPFTFTGEPVGSSASVVASALERDGTAWVLTVNGPAIMISARAADGTFTAPASVSANFAAPPVLAVSDGTATVAWLTVRLTTLQYQRVTVHVRRCTLSGCAPGQAVYSWDQTGSPIYLGGGPINPQLAIAGAGGRAVVVFQRFGVPDPQMMWAQSEGSRFGAAQSFGVQGNADPAIVSEPNGRIFAAWFSDGGFENDVDGECPHAAPIDWSQWSPAHGFSPVHSTAAGSGGYCASLNVVATGDGATLAWRQGNHYFGVINGPTNEKVWVSRQHGGAFSKPRAVLSGAFTISLAAASDVVAVGAATGTNGPGPTPGWLPAVQVTSSVSGAPFSKPVLLDGMANPPNVSVDSAGDVLATWFSDPGDTPLAGSEELAVAPPNGSFSAPIALDIGLAGAYSWSSALIDTVGQQSFITLAGPATPTSTSASISGVFATP